LPNAIDDGRNEADCRRLGIGDYVLKTIVNFRSYGSIIQHFAPVDVAEFVAQVGDKSHIMWTMQRADQPQ
jgi:hypothetical protein